MAGLSDSSATTSIFGGVACPAAAAAEGSATSVFDTSLGSSSGESKPANRGRAPDLTSRIPSKIVEAVTGVRGGRNVRTASPVSRFPSRSQAPRSREESPMPSGYGPVPRASSNPVRWRSQGADPGCTDLVSAAKRRIVEEREEPIGSPVSWSTHGNGGDVATAGPIVQGRPVIPPINLPLRPNGVVEHYQMSDGDGGDGDDGSYGSPIGSDGPSPDFEMEIQAGIAQVNVQNIQGDVTYNTMVNVVNNPNHAEAIQAAAQQSQQAASDAVTATMITAEARHSAIQAEGRARMNEELSAYKMEITNLKAAHSQAIAEGKAEVTQLLAQKNEEIKRSQFEAERVRLQYEAQAKSRDEEVERIRRELQGVQQTEVRLRNIEAQFQGMAAAKVEQENEVARLREQLRNTVAPSEGKTVADDSMRETAIKEAARKCIDHEKGVTENTRWKMHVCVKS